MSQLRMFPKIFARWFMLTSKNNHVSSRKYRLSGWRVPKINPLTPNDPYRVRTALLTSKRCILYIYSTNIGTGYSKHGIYSPFFFLQNVVSFIILTYLVPVLFTFYIEGLLKLKKNNSGPKSLWIYASALIIGNY